MKPTSILCRHTHTHTHTHVALEAIPSMGLTTDYSKYQFGQRYSKRGKGMRNLNYCQYLMYTWCHICCHHARCKWNWVNGGHLPNAWVCSLPLTWFSDPRPVQRSVSNFNLFGRGNGGGCGGGDWFCEEVTYEGTVFSVYIHIPTLVTYFLVSTTVVIIFDCNSCVLSTVVRRFLLQ